MADFYGSVFLGDEDTIAVKFKPDAKAHPILVEIGGKLGIALTAEQASTLLDGLMEADRDASLANIRDKESRSLSAIDEYVREIA